MKPKLKIIETGFCEANLEIDNLTVPGVSAIGFHLETDSLVLAYKYLSWILFREDITEDYLTHKFQSTRKAPTL